MVYMSVKTVVFCDNCGAQQEVTSEYVGWFTLTYEGKLINTDHVRPSLHLCSRQCVIDVVTNVESMKNG